MMCAVANQLEWVRQARASVREAQVELLTPTPEALDRCGPPLQRATRSLEALAQALKSGAQGGHPDLRSALNELSKEVVRVATLLENAAGFYLGWARWLFAATCGYTAQGEPGAPEGKSSLSVEA
jgi:hypothetical protein